MHRAMGDGISFSFFSIPIFVWMLPVLCAVIRLHKPLWVNRRFSCGTHSSVSCSGQSNGVVILKSVCVEFIFHGRSSSMYNVLHNQICFDCGTTLFPFPTKNERNNERKEAMNIRRRSNDFPFISSRFISFSFSFVFLFSIGVVCFDVAFSATAYKASAVYLLSITFGHSYFHAFHHFTNSNNVTTLDDWTVIVCKHTVMYYHDSRVLARRDEDFHTFVEVTTMLVYANRMKWIGKKRRRITAPERTSDGSRQHGISIEWKWNERNVNNEMAKMMWDNL